MSSNSGDATSSVESVFSGYVEHLHADHEIREAIRTKLRELEQSSREVTAQLQKIHQPTGLTKINEVLIGTKALFQDKVRPQLKELVSLVPEKQYYRFHFMLNFTIQRLAFASSLLHFLEHENMVTKEQVAKDYLDLKVNPNDGFHLDLEDYLTGLILMSNELSRFCVNCVTQGDYERPVRIATFLNEMLNGFRLLNLKNDNLRKKFDSLKYDLKKVEEVVYDITIHGLIKPPKEE